MAETIPPGALERDITRDLTRTRLGTLFQKDTCDLFCSLMLSIKLAKHKRMAFKTYHNSFLGHDAMRRFESLMVIRSPDARDPANLIPMSMRETNSPEDSALWLMQLFVDSSLIQDATTKEETLFFEKSGIYTPTPKGVRILEEFIRECDLEAEAAHLVAVLGAQPMPRPKLIRISRNPADDELILTHPVVWHLFRHLAGRTQNYTYKGWQDDTGVLLSPRSETARMLKTALKKDPRPLSGKISAADRTHCVQAARIIHWLCGHTTISSPREAAEVAAQLVRFGLIVYVGITGGGNAAQSTKFTVNGPVVRGNPSVTATAEFIYSYRAIYAVTTEGCAVAGWLHSKAARAALLPDFNASNVPDATPLKEEPEDPVNAARLRKFIKDPALRVLFRQFLSESRCENDLSFWIDVEDFKTEFEIASALSSPPILDLPPVEGSSATPLEPPPPPTRPHESLGNRPFLIYNTYFTPAGNCQLSVNIGNDLQEELKRTLEQCVENLTNKILLNEAAALSAAAGDETTLGIDQLAIIAWLFGRIQNRVFCTLADEQIPKFLKWPKFLATRIDELVTSKEAANHSPAIVVDKGKRKAVAT
ncbi:hypothetical protein HYPSUDRAFT_39616 [Hypholoma sublateritium FD-334 SS-4]|uniref:RGS domain-containing protein n=1 Tax=Hypholoma sublateritium (strain FD-334 SS-4) TaxID=945553 RepID=A0A0D2MJD2_HYPSF|nr:hypothetical protein HYPSUDRAFT_39616 [Hypholoma sublateritium FD-334 SS-4]